MARKSVSRWEEIVEEPEFRQKITPAKLRIESL
jgi:hypothetical protein